jgi:regulator of protease activity HflC (stomatin/prohibitin superfamily)
VGWIVFLALAVPLVAIFVWQVLSGSVVHVPAGRLGLLLIKGRATDKALGPGPHWVPTLRRRMIAEYPSVELSYRATLDPIGSVETSELERTGPAPRVTLGDRTELRLGYTVRFRLEEAQLRTVHDRFGPDGLWPAIRDLTARAVRRAVGADAVGVDSLFGGAAVDLEQALGSAVAEELAPNGLSMTMFAVGDWDLGRAGDVIQTTVRARLELDREEAESQMRLARARIDAELEPYAAAVSDAALRYREVDVLRDLARAPGPPPLVVPARAPAGQPSTVAPAPAEEVPADLGPSTEVEPEP